MKIIKVTVKETRNKITLAAVCKIRRIGLDKVYFTFDKKYKSYIYADASPFAVSLLFPSMKQGEDLIIKGSISKQLYEGMHEIMKVVSSWDIGLNPINIVVDKVEDDSAKPKIVATFFSGGIDSYYTYLKRKNDIKNAATHLLLIKGFDIDLQNNRLWKTTLNNIKNIANTEKTNLVEVESNIRQLLEPILPWDYTHGECLAAVGLCLRKKIRLVYIPSSHTAEQQTPHGSHPEIDHRWGTEVLNFIHDGTEASRIQKVAWQIAKSTTALMYLRVCFKQLKEEYNCGKCEKCVRTMINLYAADALKNSKTFPNSIDLNQVANLRIADHVIDYYKENLEELERNNLNPKLQKMLREKIHNVEKNKYSTTDSIIKYISYMDHMYFYGYLRKTILPVMGRKY